MTQRAGPRPAAVLMLLLAVLLIAPPSPATPAAQAAGEEPTATAEPEAVTAAPGTDRPPVGEGSLAIRIMDLVPAIPRPGEVLSVRGSITNTSARPVTDVDAVLRLSPTPVTNRDEIPEVLAGRGLRTGVPVAGADLAVTAELAPGATQTFRIDADVDRLDLSRPGVYVTGLEALGDSGAGLVRQDLDRTFLPWWTRDAGIEPVALSTLWPLSAPALRDADGVLLNEGLGIAMSPSGRLARLLQAGQRNPGAVSLIVDPELVASAAAMVDGYRVHAADGALVDGKRSSEAAGWLAQLTSALAEPGVDVSSMLSAWPDVDAARRGRLLNRVLRQQAEAEQVAEAVVGTRLATTLALPAGGRAQPQTLANLARAAMDAVVLSDVSAPLDEPTFFTPSGNVVLPTGRGDLPGLLADSRLSATLARPMDTPAQQAAVRQALLAQTLVTAGELPETPRLLVAAVDPTWSPPPRAAQMVVEALTAAPWVTPLTLPEALARDAGTLPRTVVEPSAEDVAAELPPRHVERTRTLYRDLRSYSAIVTEPADIPQVTRTAATRLLSSWLRSRPRARGSLTGWVDAQFAARLDSVHVLSSGSITVSGTSGSIPVTVDNTGPQQVTVGLELSATPSQLFEADPVPPFTVDPGRRTSVVATAQVAASGPVPVSIRLVTSDGRAFGAPTVLVVESAAYANAARLLVRVAIVALVITVLVHGVRRARRRRAARAGRRQDRPAARPLDSSGAGRG